MTDPHFSARHRFAPNDIPIVVREDAPFELRGMLADFAYEAGLRPSSLRGVVCRVLMIPPSSDNWSEYPNIDLEVRGDVRDCAWYEIYDVIEAVWRSLQSGDRYAGRSDGELGSEKFARLINELFVRKGIGWQLIDGRIEVRGPEVFETTVRPTALRLQESHPTAAQEIHEALQDLARRPTPDLTGAVQHSMAALECVARSATNEPTATLGAILNRHPNLIPAPLNTAIEKAWGFASEMGRHVREGRAVAYEEAELVVMIAAAAASYLERTLQSRSGQP